MIASVVLAPAAARAQVLHGEWVDESDKAIEQHRKTDVAVIVLDQNDRAIRGAKVRIEQQRHDFVLGLAIPADRKPPKGLAGLPVYRCFNAIALDRLKMDPAIASSVFVTTVTDVVGFFAFLSLAAWWFGLN